MLKGRIHQVALEQFTADLVQNGTRSSRGDLGPATMECMARTMATSAADATWWDEEFRRSWIRLLTEVVEAVASWDGPRLGHVRSEIAELAERLWTQSLTGSTWQEYGGLLSNLRNVTTSLEQLVTSGPGSGVEPRRTKRPGPRLRRLAQGYRGWDERATS